MTDVNKPSGDAIPFWEEQNQAASPTSAKERLIALLDEVSDVTDDMDYHQKEADAKAERLAELKRVLIPDLMDEMGVSEIKLEDKTKVTVKKSVNVSVKAENKQGLFDWLVDNEFGGLIKSNIQAEFSREEIEQAMQIAESLRSEGIDATLKQDVHAATLKSFINERLEAGEPLPPQVATFEYREAKIVLPKVKK